MERERKYPQSAANVPQPARRLLIRDEREKGRDWVGRGVVLFSSRDQNQQDSSIPIL